MKPLKLAIIASGRGSAIPPIIAAITKRQLNASIEIIISNKAAAPVLQLAKDHHIKAAYISSQPEISVILKQHHIDLILLIGYMRILSKEFVQTWENKIINVHPSLLPAYAGLMNLQVHQEVLAAGEQETGCTVHMVTEDVDAGPILVQKHCAVMANDTPETLKARVQKLESLALIDAIRKIGETYD